MSEQQIYRLLSSNQETKWWKIVSEAVEGFFSAPEASSAQRILLLGRNVPWKGFSSIQRSKELWENHKTKGPAWKLMQQLCEWLPAKDTQGHKWSIQAFVLWGGKKKTFVFDKSINCSWRSSTPRKFKWERLFLDQETALVYPPPKTSRVLVSSQYYQF